MKLTFLLLLLLGIALAGFGQQNLSSGLGTSASRRSADTHALWMNTSRAFDFSGNERAPASSLNLLSGRTSLGGITYLDMEIPPPEDSKPPVSPTPAPVTPVLPTPAPTKPAPAYDDDTLFWTGFGFLMSGLVALAIGIPSIETYSDGTSLLGDDGSIGLGLTIGGGLGSLIGLIFMVADID
jgi:hypothetical protein